MLVALGFRAHSGWAAMVAVAGTRDAPLVMERRRLVIADPAIPGSKQPYHAAAGLPLPDAESLIRAAIASSQALARQAISAVVAELRLQEREVAGCGVLLGSGRVLPGLEAILASHARIHSAEGEMFRRILIGAARECTLPVTTVRESEIDGALLNRVSLLGKRLGPPWTQDQKYAAVAALLALD